MSSDQDMFRAVERHIDDNREASLELLFELLRQPSISAQDIGVDECAELELRIMSECGLDAQLLATQGKPIVYGQRLQAPGMPTILVYGHYDVQPVEPLDRWVTPPFEPTIRDGRIFARGSGDNKGQHLANLLGIKSFLAIAGELPVNVKVILEGQEESASPHLAAFVHEHRDLLATDFAYTSDGPVHETGRSEVVFGVRGTLQVELTVRGANSDYHSGGKGGIVPNAAWRMVDLLATMRDDRGEVSIEGFYDTVRPPKPMELRAIEDLPLDLPQYFRDVGINELPEPEGIGFYERLMLRPTLSICGLVSGYTGDGFKTAIPSEAHAKLDMRLVPNQNPDDVFRLFSEHVRKHSPEAEVHLHGAMEPSRTDIDMPFSAAIIDAVTRADGERPLVIPSHGGSLPDYVFTRVLGVPSVIVPYANHDERNHAPNENMEVERFYRGMKIFSSVIDSLGRGRAGGDHNDES